MANFEAAFVMLVGNEGGYSYDPHDPGGETMYGVTLRVARLCGYKGVMRELPLETARQIAKQEYWDPFQCDRLPDVIAFQVLDIAYNGGFPAKWLQLALGVMADGKVGEHTIAVAGKLDDADQMRVVMRMNAYRLTYYTGLNGFKFFGRGWANRVAANLLRGAQ